MEEMGLDYELEVMQFPPRFLHPGYAEINPIGTVPYFVDDRAGISQYLVDRYGPSTLAVEPSEVGYGGYLNWIHRSDATLTFPQTLVLRYTLLEPEATRLPKVAEDYTKWFYSRLRSVDLATADNDFLVANRFTIADITVGYALYLADTLGLAEGFKPNTKAYYERLKQRPAFQKAISL
jgi:glutathione S-transferase